MDRITVATEPPRSLLPPRLLIIAAGLWLAVAIPYLTDAACDFRVLLALVGSGGVLGLGWFALTVVRPFLLQPPVRVWWLSVPAMGALGVVLLLTDRDLALRVALCEPSLNRFVARLRAEPEAVHAPQWVGLFRVDRISEYEGGVYLFTSESFLNSHGVAHIPPGVMVAPRMRIHHLYGPWYNFEWRF